MTLPEQSNPGYQAAVAALLDPRLSYRAKGILAAALTYDPSFGCVLTRPWIDNHGTEGREAISSALAELRDRGLYRLVLVHDEKGRRQGSDIVFCFQDFS